MGEKDLCGQQDVTLRESSMFLIKGHRPKHLVEYAVFSVFGLLFRCLPYRGALAIGWAIAWIGHYAYRYRVKMVYDRIQHVFPEMEPARVRKVAWVSWRNFVFNLVDTFRLKTINDAWLKKHVLDYEAYHDFTRVHVPERGAICISIHMGSAEMTAVSLQRDGRKVFVIAREQKNRLVDQGLNALRESTGIDCIIKTKSGSLFKSVLRRLREGGVLAMLVDIRQEEGGVLVPFLGAKASVAPGLGLFSKKTGVPVIASVITREGWTRHRIHMLPPLWPDATLSLEEDIQRMTRHVFVYFDESIRKQPEQWFWYNKNWILKPVAADHHNGNEHV